MVGNLLGGTGVVNASEQGLRVYGITEDAKAMTESKLLFTTETLRAQHRVCGNDHRAVPNHPPKFRRHGFQPLTDQPGHPDTGSGISGLQDVVLGDSPPPPGFVRATKQKTGDGPTFGDL